MEVTALPLRHAILRPSIWEAAALSVLLASGGMLTSQCIVAARPAPTDAVHKKTQRRPAVSATEIISPPLVGTTPDHTKLIIQAPPGWVISRRDPAQIWKQVQYTFDLVPKRAGPDGGSQARGLADCTLYADVLQWALSRARRDGNFDGTPFRTSTGLKGILHREVYDNSDHKSSEYAWYLTIPIPSTDSALVARVVSSFASRRRLEAAAIRVLRSVRFVKARPRGSIVGRRFHSTVVGN